MPDRSTGVTSLLPSSSKEKEGKSKEENHKLLNGNSGESVDWVFKETLFLDSYSSFIFLQADFLRWCRHDTDYMRVITTEAEDSNEWQDYGRRPQCPSGFSHEWCVGVIRGHMQD